MSTLALVRSLAIVAMLCSCSAWAQQQPQDSQSDGPQLPAQPISPLGSGADGQPIPNDSGRTQSVAQPGVSGQAQPDTHVLSSFETFTVGSLTRLPRIFDPSLFVSEFDETGLVPGRPIAVSNLGGSLVFDQHWDAYSLALTYNGAETLYRPSLLGSPNLPYQNASISQQVLLGRWTLRLRDNAQLSWGSTFGGLFAGGPGQFGQFGTSGGIQPFLNANGTIDTGLARQVNNTAAAEVDYALSHRATLTFVASYGLLHFSEPGYIDNQFIDGRVGYNYALSAANSISFAFEHDLSTFGGASDRVQTDSIQVSFGRKITGRLAFQAAAGPQLIHFQDFGSSGTPQVSWTASSGLTYSLVHSSYSFSYSHFVAGGSGVFFGSTDDTFTARANRAFTRSWSGSVNVGYALNRNLAGAGGFASRFDNWYAGASLGRQIGQQVNLSLIYGFDTQTNGAGVCPVLSCGLPGSLVFRQFGASLQWHPLARAR